MRARSRSSDSPGPVVRDNRNVVFRLRETARQMAGVVTVESITELASLIKKQFN